MLTAQKARLSQVLSAAEKTRLLISLAIFTNDNSVKDTFLNGTQRVTFDVQLVFLNGTETEYIFKSVNQNKAWKDVRVAYV